MTTVNERMEIPHRRSDDTLQFLRETNPWPKNKHFKILAIDGGGIRGLLPCLILAELEKRFLNGGSIGRHFDMLVGTSSGGIIVLSLGLGKSAKEISQFYFERGSKIFPGSRKFPWRKWKSWFAPSYDLRDLKSELTNIFGDELLKNIEQPVSVPSLEGFDGEPCIFKTPFHTDFERDGDQKIVDVALSTAAAPTYFRAHDFYNNVFLDGGIWANNPSMIGVVDALSCFETNRTQIRLLSLGCGQQMHRLKKGHVFGGKLFWANQIFNTVSRAQSHNALSQAGLLIGKQNLVRLDAPEEKKKTDLDNIEIAFEELPGIARSLVEGSGHKIAEVFLNENITK